MKRHYIIHPWAVATSLMNAGVTDNATLCAALLHDVLEDTPTAYEALVHTFGEDVADLVAEVTDDPGLSSVAAKEAQVEKIARMSPAAQMIKLADKLHNIQELLEFTPNWTADGIAWYTAKAREMAERVLGNANPVIQLFAAKLLCACVEVKERVRP